MTLYISQINQININRQAWKLSYKEIDSRSAFKRKATLLRDKGQYLH